MVVWCAVTSNALADDPRHRLRFQRFGEVEGLTSPSIRALLQDRTGFLWIGTLEGLVRFDGSSFKSFPLFESPESEPIVTALLEADGPGLWIGTEAGLAFLDREDHSVRWWDQEVPTPSDDSLGVVDLELDNDGNLWAATSHGGLCRIEASTISATCWRHDPENPASIASDELTDIELSRSGHFWIATAHHGLDRCDLTTGLCDHFRHDPNRSDSLSSNRLNAVLEDHRGEVWVGTYGTGLDRLDDKGGLLRHYPYRHDDPAHPSSRSVKTLHEDDQGRLWLGTWGSGINVLNRDRDRFLHRGHHPDVADSISDDRVLALTTDHLGRMWIGTYYGLDVHDPARELFTVYRHDADDPTSLRDNRVQSVLEDRRGRLWIGSYHHGLARVDPDGSVHHYEADPDDRRALANSGVWSLHEDQTGTIWAGTSRGLHRYLEDEQGWERQQYEVADPAPFSNNNILTITEDSSGILWLGTWAGTLDRFDPKNGEVTQHLPDPNDPAALPGHPIRDLAFDREGRLWIASSGGGLIRHLPGTSSFEQFRHDPSNLSSLGNNLVNGILLDSRSQLWAASESSLDRWLPEHKAFERHDVGQKVNVHDLVEDDRARLWLATNKGLVCYDPATRNFRHYGVVDGLQSTALHIGATERGPSTLIYTGGVDGLSVFDPLSLPLSGPPPQIALTEFRLLNRAVEVANGSLLERDVAHVDRITLRPEQYSFGFEFAAVMPRHPGKVSYAYQLQGVDPDWVEVEADERRVTYTGLPHGDYSFRARAATSVGWSEPVVIEVVVLPFWWQSTWFRALLIGALLASLLGTARWRFAALRRRNLKLAELVAERTRELEASAKQLEEASLTDPLTGLSNRRFIAQHLGVDVEQTQRAYREASANSPADKDLVFILLDLDHFKLINDQYGHSTGDRVLAHVAFVLQRECRASDFVVRWGGEEFLIVARTLDRNWAFAAADRLRRAIATNPVELDSGGSLSLTCSVGVAAFPFDTLRPEAFTWEQVVDAADAGLYAAKQAGRNTTVAVAATSRTDVSTLHHRISHDFDALLDEGTLTVARS